MAAFDEMTLLVEGLGDRHVITQLYEAFGTWGNSKSEYPFEIRECKGNSDLLQVVLPERLKSSVRTIGVVIDADEDPVSCWNSFRNTCLSRFPGIPDLCPESGLIWQNAQGRRLGVWLMPDNRQRGMLEAFLQFLIPTDAASLWQFSSDVARDARSAHGAPYREVHVDKARIHTWLAWQDPPGQIFGDAIKDRCLQPNTPLARQFMDWIWRLFELPGNPVFKEPLANL